MSVFYGSVQLQNACFLALYDYRINDGETLIFDDSSLAKRIVDAYNLGFSDCKAIVCSNLSYQPVGDCYMAIACFDN